MKIETIQYETIKNIYVCYFDSHGYMHYEEKEQDDGQEQYVELNDELIPLKPCEYKFFKNKHGQNRVKVTFYETYKKVFLQDKYGNYYCDKYEKVLSSQFSRQYLKLKLLYRGK